MPDFLGWLGNAFSDVGAEVGLNPHRTTDNALLEFAGKDIDRAAAGVQRSDNPAMRARIEELRARGNFQNPYDNAMAGQARPEQAQALRALMAMAQGGGNVSNLQNNLQQNQLFNAAARNGRSNFADNPQVLQALGGLSAQRGQGQLQEQMGLMGAAGQSANNLRGQDLNQFGANQNFGLQARGQNNQVNLAAHGLGSQLTVDEARYLATIQDMINRQYGRKMGDLVTGVTGGLSAIGSAAGTIMGGAGGGALAAGARGLGGK